jgi:hypothetical protein
LYVRLGKHLLSETFGNRLPSWTTWVGSDWTSHRRRGKRNATPSTAYDQKNSVSEVTAPSVNERPSPIMLFCTALLTSATSRRSDSRMEPERRLFIMRRTAYSPRYTIVPG